MRWKRFDTPFWNNSAYIMHWSEQMDFRKIEAFLTVAKTGKYTEAADKLFISQSSLSKQMSQMEKELGIKLFKKTRNGVELTQAGQDFYSYAHRALPEYQRACSRLQMYREGGTYPIRMGALPLTEEYGFADAFSNYWVHNTQVQLEYFERSQGDLISKLERHKIDLAVVRGEMLDASSFTFLPLVKDELTLVCSRKHPLASLEVVDVSELRNEQFILLEEKSDVTTIFRRACEHAGFCPNAPLHHARHRMLIKAVQKNMGISVLPRRLASTYLASDISIVSFKQPLYSTLGFAWLADEPLTPTLRTFANYIAEEFDVPGIEG